MFKGRFLTKNSTTYLRILNLQLWDSSRQAMTFCSISSISESFWGALVTEFCCTVHPSTAQWNLVCSGTLPVYRLGCFEAFTFLFQLYCKPLGLCKNGRKAKQVCFNPDFIGFFILKVRISILGVWVIRSWDVIIIRASFIVLKNYKSVLSACFNILDRRISTWIFISCDIINLRSLTFRCFPEVLELRLGGLWSSSHVECDILWEWASFSPPGVLSFLILPLLDESCAQLYKRQKLSLRNLPLFFQLFCTQNEDLSV